MSKRVRLLMLAFAMLVLVAISAEGAEPDWQDTLKRNPGPLSEKLLVWLNVTRNNTPISIREMINFTLENPDWPKLYAFRDRVENGISPPSFRPSEIAAWFDQNPPKSAAGIKYYMAALVRLGHNDKAAAALRKFWIDAELNRQETLELSSLYKNLFSPTSNIDRLDNLLWSQRYQEAEYMLPLIDAGHDKLAQARIGLGRMSQKASRLVHAVPAGLQNDSGLLYDRIKWRRQMNKDDDAVSLLLHAPKNTTHQDMWWRERNILARRALEKKGYARAYKIILGHGMTSGIDYSQAEWLLGWLSLRFLNHPDNAYRHFDNFYQAVNSAVSRSRAAYWLGRASDAMHKRESARNWYKLGSQFPSTFYGQLSSWKIGMPIESGQFSDDQVPPETAKEFESTELAQAIRLLSRLGLSAYSDPFFIKLLDKAKDRQDFVVIARLARETGRNYFAVEANKQMQQKIGAFMFTEGYPILPLLPIDRPESALIHAIVHRESMFDANAASPAGARGLMQLMPATARHASKSLGKEFTIGKLTDNPQYNIELGAAYLQSLLDDYDGFYPLAIAAYNAGPGNVNQWIDEFGDPRRKHVDTIDWIEQIPIYETRNYVQRVMESYYIYKLRLSEKPKTVFDFARK